MEVGEDAPAREPLRLRVYDFIQRNPGCHILQMARHFRLTHPTVMYHLGVLHRQGLVVSDLVGKRRAHFDARCRYTAWEREVLAVLAVGEPLAILHRVAAQPGTFPRELARDLDVSENAIKRHVPNLLRLNLLQCEEGAFRRRLWVSPTLRRRGPALLARLPPGAPQASHLGVLTAPPREIL